MNNSAYIRAIRGPVLLIVLGVLMLLDHRTELSFWQTWPLLLVTGGLLVLAERAAIRENPWTAPAADSGFTPPPPSSPPPPSTINYRPFGQPDPDAPTTHAAGNEPGGGAQA